MNRAGAGNFVCRLHADQRGSMSIVSLFAVLLLAMLLGMVVNAGRHADRKVQMQNAADGAAYSGGVVLARGMNTLAFTNHLLCDVFGMTAYLREARDRNAESLAGPVLDSWEAVGPVFRSAPYPKFAALGDAITQKVPLEREMVRTFSEEQAAVSEQLLPVMEAILAEEAIPEFQRALVLTTPRLAQSATDAIVGQHGMAGSGLGGGQSMRGVLWRTDVAVVGGDGEWVRSTLPVADPTLDESPYQVEYRNTARRQRRDMANRYLEQLNRPMLQDFDRVGKMSQFGQLWRGFTSGQLDRLLNEEYPDRNLPFVLRHDDAESLDPNLYLESQFMFVGVTYWPQMPERLPGLFRNPLDADDMAFAQVSVFLPRPRLVMYRDYDDDVEGDYEFFGDFWYVHRQNSPTSWDLMNQNWTVQLVPATSRSVPTILQTSPPGLAMRAQNLGGISVEGFRRINTH